MPDVTLVSSLDGMTGLWLAANAPERISSLAVIRGASHFAHYEQPGPVTDALLTHFAATAG